MTTSGTYSFNPTVSQILNAVGRKLNIVDDDNALTTNQQTNMQFALDSMLKAFIAEGMPIWEISDITIPISSFTTDTNGCHISIGTGQTFSSVPAPMKFLSCVNQDISNPSNPIRIPMFPLTNYDFHRLAQVEGNVGKPTQWWGQVLNQIANLYIWVPPDTYSTTNCQIVATCQFPFQDTGSLSNTLDFPQYWYDAIIFGLAWRLAGDYGLPMMDRQALTKDAQYMLEKALEFGTEEGSIRFEPEWIHK